MLLIIGSAKIYPLSPFQLYLNYYYFKLIDWCTYSEEGYLNIFSFKFGSYEENDFTFPKSKVRATIVELTVNWIQLYWAIDDVRCDWITEHLWLNHGCPLKHTTYRALIVRCCWCFWEIILSILNALVLDHYVTY